MSLTLRWVGESDYDRVAEARMRCYAPAARDLPRFQEGIRADPRGKPGDFLLAEDDGQAVGTTTAYGFTMWVRSAPLPCQGVAYVGTLRTHRRTADAPAADVTTATPAAGPGRREPGIASRLMHETLRMARERGQVLTALMPFRVSFYDHFGYGVVESRVRWTIPLAILPAGPCAGIRLARPDDRPAIAALHQRTVERGQCDIERSPERWAAIDAQADAGFEVVDPEPAAAGPGPLIGVGRPGTLRGYLAYRQYSENGKDILDVQEQAYADFDSLRRQLHFLASLKDQYFAASLTLPADVPLNWLLREAQLPHRLVNHPTADAHPYTRMQMRVLDHRRLIEALRLPADAVRAGEVTIGVREAEGNVSRFRLTFGHESQHGTYIAPHSATAPVGRVEFTPTDATPQIECPDRVWAAVVLGDLPAATAFRLGLMASQSDSAARLLDAFAAGPPPFSREYF